jgi:hypothetical protein
VEYPAEKEKEVIKLDSKKDSIVEGRAAERPEKDQGTRRDYSGVENPIRSINLVKTEQGPPIKLVNLEHKPKDKASAEGRKKKSLPVQAAMR